MCISEQRLRALLVSAGHTADQQDRPEVGDALG